jgi:hypothetical protein
VGRRLAREARYTDREDLSKVAVDEMCVYLDILTGLSSKEDRYDPVVEDYNKGDFCRTALGGH